MSGAIVNRARNHRNAPAFVLTKVNKFQTNLTFFVLVSLFSKCSNKHQPTGNHFERRLCQCEGPAGSFQTRSLIKQNRNLRITDIRQSESGMYYCARDDGSTSSPDDEHIVSRAEVVVIPLTASHYVANFTLDKSVQAGTLATVGLGEEVALEWDVFDELPCTDCGYRCFVT